MLFGGLNGDQCRIEFRICHGFAPNEDYIFEPWVSELEVNRENLAAFADDLEYEAVSFPVIGVPE